MRRTYYVYIMASRKHGTLYIGVTNDVAHRSAQHRAGEIPSFTKRYGVTRLVWHEEFDDIHIAIQREKTMQKWPREWKTNLIERDNSNWDDLGIRLMGS
jgi:putative endonuclease